MSIFVSIWSLTVRLFAAHFHHFFHFCFLESDCVADVILSSNFVSVCFLIAATKTEVTLDAGAADFACIDCAKTEMLDCGPLLCQAEDCAVFYLRRQAFC